VNRHFGGLAPGRTLKNGGPPKPAAAIVTRSKKELEQVHLCLGTRAWKRGLFDLVGGGVVLRRRRAHRVRGHQPRLADEVVRLTVDEFRRMREEPVPAEELRRAKDPTSRAASCCRWRTPPAA
jgi:hypothetical protein